MTAPARFIFNRCKPVGTLSFGRVSDGALITRPWTVTCNADPAWQTFLDNGPLDPESIARHSDANLLYKGRPLAHVTEWEPTIDIDTAEFRAGGGRARWDIDLGYKCQLTFTETLVSDAEGSGGLFETVLKAIILGTPLNLQFQTVIRSRSSSLAAAS